MTAKTQEETTNLKFLNAHISDARRYEIQVGKKKISLPRRNRTKGKVTLALMPLLVDWFKLLGQVEIEQKKAEIAARENTPVETVEELTIEEMQANVDGLEAAFKKNELSYLILELVCENEETYDWLISELDDVEISQLVMGWTANVDPTNTHADETDQLGK